MEISVLSRFSWKACRKRQVEKEHSSVILPRGGTLGLEPWRDHSQTFLLAQSLTELSQLLNLCQSCAFCIPCRLPLTLTIKQNSPFGSQNPQGWPLSLTQPPRPCLTASLNSLFYKVSDWTLSPPPQQHCTHSLPLSVCSQVPHSRTFLTTLNLSYCTSISPSIYLGIYSQRKRTVIQTRVLQVTPVQKHDSSLLPCVSVPPTQLRRNKKIRAILRVWIFCKCD